MAFLIPNIMFGDFMCSQDGQGCILLKERPLTAPPAALMAPMPSKPKEVKKVDPFAKLEQKLAPYLEKRALAKVRKGPNGLLLYRKPTETAYQRHLTKKERLRREELAFQNADPYLVTKIVIAGGEKVTPTNINVGPKKPLNKTPSMKKKVSYKVPTITMEKLDWLIRQVKNIAIENNLKIEVIGRKKHKIRYASHKNKPIACLHLPHMDGVKKAREVRLHDHEAQIISILANTNTFGARIWDKHLEQGTSGFIFNGELCCGQFGRCKNGMFIVRGRLDGMMVDAQSKVSYHVMHRMHHY
nr:P1-Pro [Brugmansia suaveolens mottle virus]